jgi:predicted MPP superfamily phosphohydrolase
MISRRTFVTSALSLASGTAVGVGAYARWGELHWVDFVDHALPLPGLPPDLDGELLVQLSDLHVGPSVSARFLVDTFERVSDMRPSFVVYTGDFITFDGPEALARASRVLRTAPRGTRGTLAVLGNHDYGHAWSDRTVAADLARRVEDLGITVLRNSSATASGIHFVGFEDLLSPVFGGASAMAGRDRTRPTVVLCHNPDACDVDVWGDYDGWVLSGHTHGGQVSFPVVGPPILPVRNKRYVAGEYALSGGRSLYINRALGHTLGLRFGVRPEVTLHRLRRA